MRRLALLLLLCRLTPAYAEDQLPALLQQNRFPLAIEHGALAGAGADLLRREIAAAQIVAIGEQHGTREIPEFAAAVCRAMEPDALAVEAGPLVTAKLAEWSAAPGGAGKLAAWDAEHPWSIAFFTWQGEFQFLSQCRAAVAPHALSLWGLDQEFLNATSFILPELIRADAGPVMTARAQALLQECDGDWKKAVASGDSHDLCILHAPYAEFADLASAAYASGNKQVALLADALAKSEHIYAAHEAAAHEAAAHEAGRGYESNRERALLLKQNFTADYNRLAGQLGRPPRVLLKLGDNHVTRSFNESDLTNLGAFLGEFADEHALSSLHIWVFARSGQTESPVGPGRPDRAVESSPSELPIWLAPLLAAADPKRATLFDLRPLRPKLNTLAGMSRELERTILGFDLVIVLPHSTADPLITAAR